MIRFPPMQLASTLAAFRLRQFASLTKPRVVSLIVFCAVIGMYLAAPGMVPPKLLIAATIGIWLVAGAAAAVNCLVEQKIDAVMTRTRARPLPRGELTSLQTLAFAGTRTSGRSRCTGPRISPGPGCRCCRSRTGTASRGSTCCSTR